jgi:hypothetical protein
MSLNQKLMSAYKEETFNEPTYNRNGAVFHALAYVDWLEDKIESLECELEIVRNYGGDIKAEILALRKDIVYADDMYLVGWNMAIERAAGVLKISKV